MRYCIALFVFLHLSYFLNAQHYTPDSVIYQLALNQTLAWNNYELSKSGGLYTGSLYVRDYYNVKGHPFFQTDSLRKGDIFYDGALYKNVNLLYDLSHDNLLIEYSEETKLVLVPEKVSYFILYGHLFVRREGSLPAGEGFYELLFIGGIDILVKRNKKIISSVRTPEFSYVFAEGKSYFIYK